MCAPGHAPLDTRVEPDAGSRDVQTFALIPASSLRGRVVFAGMPVAGSAIELRAEAIDEARKFDREPGFMGPKIKYDVVGYWGTQADRPHRCGRQVRARRPRQRHVHPADRRRRRRAQALARARGPGRERARHRRHRARAWSDRPRRARSGTGPVAGRIPRELGSRQQRSFGKARRHGQVRVQGPRGRLAQHHLDDAAAGDVVERRPARAEDQRRFR